MSTKVENLRENPTQDDRITWKEFADQTTLHGIRYVFVDRPKPLRALWLVFVIAASGYLLNILVRSLIRYNKHPVNTAIFRERNNTMQFPSITLCPLNSLEKSKLHVLDSDPRFSVFDMNQSACAVTAELRHPYNYACGIAMACCCYDPDVSVGIEAFGFCDRTMTTALKEAMKKSNTTLDMKRFHRSYSTLLNETIIFSDYYPSFEGHNVLKEKDFKRVSHDEGDCFTVSSRPTNVSGNGGGLKLLVDTRIHEYTVSKYSIGTKVFVHNPGEYYTHGGVTVSPGTHALITLSVRQFVNLKEPFPTKCRDRVLKGFSLYTIPGCEYECWMDRCIDKCGCRYAGYTGQPLVRVCTVSDLECVVPLQHQYLPETCDCPTPCKETTYTLQTSYSKFPSPGISHIIKRMGFNTSVQYQSENLALIQIRFDSLSYELYQQTEAYPGEAFFGEFGGNLGLFLGCSLMTLVEFLDFFITWIWSMKNKYKVPRQAWQQ